MPEAKIAGRQPAKVTLEPGRHAWCACGLSKNQPHCDGTHRGTEFRPLKFETTEEQEVFLCMCKRTKTPPYCDGSHRKLPVQTTKIS